MIVQTHETLASGSEFVVTVSDEGFKIQNVETGDVYDEAWDPVALAPERSYVETDEMVEPDVTMWTEDCDYMSHDLVTYDGETWECLQSHTSTASLTPDEATSLWLMI